MKSWNPGDDRVEPYMKEVIAAIYDLKYDMRTHIYNKAYEAVRMAITDRDPAENKDDRILYWLEELHTEIFESFHAYRSENDLNVEFTINGSILSRIIADAKIRLLERLNGAV